MTSRIPPEPQNQSEHQLSRHWRGAELTRPFRIALAQINCTVGDLGGNMARILAEIDRARELGADLVAFPELAITGYPPEDLLLKPHFIEDNLAHLRRVIAASQGIAVVVGFVDLRDDLYNAAAVIQNGHLLGIYHKVYLPTYGVFDEDRYFQMGEEYPVFAFGDVVVGVNICEDIWYPAGPTSVQSARGAQLIVNINGSPYHRAKRAQRERMLATRATDDLVIVAYVNMVGGQDELVFDGGSVIFNQRGQLVARASQFEEDLLVADLDLSSVLQTRLHDPRRRKEHRMLRPAREEHGVITAQAPIEDRPRPALPQVPRHVSEPGSPEEIYAALVLGTRDYVHKTGFQTVLIGLSGGIDSAITATIAVDALGPENVVGVLMPSRYTSTASVEDAERTARALGIKLLCISIEPAFQAMLQMLSGVFAGTQPGAAEENLQARIRGNILMAISNKFGYLVLTTGNKSEYATGYTTLYGDMAGGFAVLKDVYKTTLYDLARYRNTQSQVIPDRVFTKAPSAELSPGQRDVDTLPPYEMLDPILRAYVEADRSFEEIVAMGFDAEVTKKVIVMVDRNEYKRRQAPPGVKITPRAFGRDRRLPITNRYRGW
ncbi:MAG: NAD+ synthase [Chloroflexota bacterium]|nr:MAG: NAD+ synthase [Chloroflexota bacterium]